MSTSSTTTVIPAADDTKSALLPPTYTTETAPFKFGQIVSTPSSSLYIIPHKPLSDTRNYRFLTLSNGLRILLISDPKTDKSAAALQVNVGHLSDPNNLPGLSHFLEHMLFLGTEKYPDEASYKKFLKDNGGGSNASTSGETTTYYFYVHKDYLEEAFDRFSSFFISPLFTESATDRELNAVDSENSKNLQDDGRRELQIKKHLSHPNRLYRKFGTGNMVTLRTNPSKENIQVRDALLNHYNTYYSANILTLSILGKESLDTLEQWVKGNGNFRTNLESIKNLNILRPMDIAKVSSFNNKEGYHPFQLEQLNQIIYIPPVKDIRTLTLYWPVPGVNEPDYSHSYSLLSHVLGYEGNGSLLSYFKSKGWANGLSSGCSKTRYFNLFSCNITLTPTGLEKINEIIQYIYQYITIMVHSPQATWEMIAKERQQVWSNTIRFQSQISPVNLVNNTVSTLQVYPAIDCLVGNSLLSNYNYTELQHILLCLWSPGNMFINCSAQYWGTEKGKEFIQQQLHNNESQLEKCTEPYYNFDYMKIPVSNSQLSLWGYSATVSPKVLQETLQKWNIDPSINIQQTICENNQWDITPSVLTPCSELRMPDINDFIPSDFQLRIPPPHRASIDASVGEDTTGPVDHKIATDNLGIVASPPTVSLSPKPLPEETITLTHPLDFPSVSFMNESVKSSLALSPSFMNATTTIKKKYGEPILLHPGSILRWMNSEGVQYKHSLQSLEQDIREKLQSYTPPDQQTSFTSVDSVTNSNSTLPIRLWMKQDTTFGLPKTYFQ